MITKLNFENVSPFRKIAQKVVNSGSKTQRDVDSENRNSLLKSARGLPEGRQFQGSNVQNILNSSARLNSQPSNITPKKARNAQQQLSTQTQNQSQQQTQYSEFLQSSQYCKTQENISPQSSYIQNTQQSQQSFSKYSPIILRQSFQKEKSQQNNSQLATGILNNQNLNHSSSGLNTSFNNLNNSNHTINNHLINNFNNSNNNNINNSNNNINNSSINSQNQQLVQQQKISQEEIKKLKLEIESFKSREIQHLVKIASMEKEAKRILELSVKLDYENKTLKNELNNLSKHKRSNTALSGRRAEENGFNNNSNSNNNIQTQGNQLQSLQQNVFQQSIQTFDKSCQVQTTSKNEQQIAILEEYTRLLRKKMKEIEQNQKQSNNSNIGGNSNMNDSSIELQNIKNNYEALKQKYKEVLERLYYIQKQGYEMKMESEFFKQFLKEKYQSYQSKSTSQSCDTSRHGHGLTSQNSFKLLAQVNSNKYSSQGENDIAPSIVRALNLPSIIK